MPSFSSFKSLSDTLKEFQITYTEDNFIQETPFTIPDYFRQDLQLMLEDGVVDSSEFAICENLIYPILKEVWKQYRKHFILWSHHYLSDEARSLSGFPEYILARRSPLGKVVFDQPYFLLIEAKQDDFEGAWAQCLSEMVTAQRLNEVSEIIVFGITSNGQLWQFGQLNGQTFTQNRNFYTIQDLDQLFAVVNYVFQQCEQQLKALIPA
ncbi:MAG: hypothetical protein F6K31_37000 [Symploca sp. SIO2G7]|nr:hypothetical protein [Symploca sp. SIO2G7]